MSQKKETVILLLAILVTLGLLGIGGWLFKKQTENKSVSTDKPTLNIDSSTSTAKERISFGEKSLLLGEISTAKKAGLEAMAAKKYHEAITNFQAALKLKSNDPETLIFLTNAQIGTNKSYTIAVSVPMAVYPDGALEVLRGVAQAQAEINSTGGINGVPLLLAIASDDDKPEIAQQVAKSLAQDPKVLGVVGHFTSDTTLAAKNVYDAAQLVAISPVSTAVKLSNSSHYIFRTVPSDYIAARALASYMVKNIQRKNVAVYFNSQSDYSQSIKAEFMTAVSLEGGQVVNEFDLSKSDFSAASSIDMATKQGVQALMLAPNEDVLDKSLQVIQVNQKRLPILGGDDVYNPKTLEIGRDAAVGMVLAVPWHIDANRNSAFVQQSRQLWHADVNWRTALAYDAARALIVAMQKNPTRTGVQQALASADFAPTGASGVIRFLPSGDRNAPIQLVTIVPGQRSRTGYDFVPLPSKSTNP